MNGEVFTKNVIIFTFAVLICSICVSVLFAQTDNVIPETDIPESRHGTGEAVQGTLSGTWVLTDGKPQGNNRASDFNTGRGSDEFHNACPDSITLYEDRQCRLYFRNGEVKTAQYYVMPDNSSIYISTMGESSVPENTLFLERNREESEKDEEEQAFRELQYIMQEDDSLQEEPYIYYYRLQE